MDWWHVALDIRSSSASPSSTGTTKSSSTKDSRTALFAQDLAAASGSAQRSAAAKAAAVQSKHTSSAPKPSATAKSASSSKPKSAADSAGNAGESSKSSASNKPAAAGQSSSSAAATAAAHTQSGQDSSSSDNTAAAANGAPGTKGRATTRAAAPKTSASQSAAANTAGDAIDDPSADVSNQSGMSLLQLLAQSLQGDDSAEPTTDSATPATTDKSAADADTLSNDPNAIALAMLAQALAAAFGASTATQQTPISNTASATAGDATAGITDATRSPDGAASMQDLMSVLTHNVAADANSNSDPGASQSNVDPTKGSGSDTSAADTAAAGPNSLAHLGVASHFSTQHMRNDTNMGELKAPVGSSAWDDELGTQLTWMTQKGLETGSLRVSPEHLGPVEVNISVRNGDASVWFGATHPDTRAALEQALPRLREMFASQGMNLTDSGVSRESPRNQSRPAASHSVSGVSAVGSSDVGTSAAVRMSLGLVDTYA
jgi:flagellar hook-length control protein FliK